MKAITPAGGKLDVKGVQREGNTIQVAAIGSDGSFYQVKAISNSGEQREILGVKFAPENLEMEIEGIKILAHIKALPIIRVETKAIEWVVVNLGPSDQNLDVVAIDKDNNEHPVRAFAGEKAFIYWI